MLKIIVNCGPCEDFIRRCLASLKAQSSNDWEAYVTVDPCGDDTFDVALKSKSGDPRIHIHQNAERLYSMVNLIHAVKRSAADPEDVIVILDGDDWFATPEALSIIEATYRQTNCWMTYGSWIAHPDDLEEERRGLWPAYPPDTTDFRNSPWLGTAVRTWKRWLWDLVDDSAFRDADGTYFCVTEDQAAMMPMLEMSGVDRAQHIAQPLMVYNRASPFACGLTRCEEMLANSAYLRTLPPYPRLLTRPCAARSNVASRHSPAAGVPRRESARA